MKKVKVTIFLDDKELSDLQELKRAKEKVYPNLGEWTLESLVMSVIMNKFGESMKELIELYQSVALLEERKVQEGTKK